MQNKIRCYICKKTNILSTRRTTILDDKSVKLTCKYTHWKHGLLADIHPYKTSCFDLKLAVPKNHRSCYICSFHSLKNNRILYNNHTQTNSSMKRIILEKIPYSTVFRQTIETPGVSARLSYRQFVNFKYLDSRFSPHAGSLAELHSQHFVGFVNCTKFTKKLLKIWSVSKKKNTQILYLAQNIAKMIRQTV